METIAHAGGEKVKKAKRRNGQRRKKRARSSEAQAQEAGTNDIECRGRTGKDRGVKKRTGVFLLYWLRRFLGKNGVCWLRGLLSKQLTMRLHRYRTIIAEAVVLAVIFIVTYKLSFSGSEDLINIGLDRYLKPTSLVTGPESTGDVAAATPEKSGSGTSSSSSLSSTVRLGMDPVDGKKLLIDNYRHENATIMTLCREEDLGDILGTIRNLEDRFNKDYHYDWVFLNNEEFSAEFKEQVTRFTSGRTRFGVIPKEHWSYPSFIDQEKAKEERQKMEDDGVIYAGSESYRHMCRFNSGFFYKHPIMMEYKYYWRVEPHVEFTCDINFDPFRYMADNNKTYGFTITIHEFERTIETLWESTKKFLAEHSDYLNKNNLAKFITNDNGETYNLCHFWSNFEIADMDFWRSKAYEDYFQYLDKTGGFFYERWGDAPVHSIAAALFLDRDRLHFFKSIGYQHGVYQMCPIEDALFTANRCYCDKKNDFTFDGYACGKEFYDAMGWKKPANWEKYAD